MDMTACDFSDPCNRAWPPPPWQFFTFGTLPECEFIIPLNFAFLLSTSSLLYVNVKKDTSLYSTIFIITTISGTYNSSEPDDPHHQQ
jgi:hypothetical protein